MPLSALYFLEVGPRISLKVATKVLFRGKKKLLNLRFSDYFSKAGTEEYDQDDWSVSDNFEIATSCLATYHLEVRAPASLKAGTKASLRGKTNSENFDFQATVLKQKRRSKTKKTDMSATNLASLYLVQLHIFWK